MSQARRPQALPTEFSEIVTANWESKGVSNDFMEYITLWGEHLMAAKHVEKKLKNEPGFDDYSAFVGELAGSSADRQGTLFIFSSLTYFIHIF